VAPHSDLVEEEEAKKAKLLGQKAKVYFNPHTGLKLVGIITKTSKSLS